MLVITNPAIKPQIGSFSGGAGGTAVLQLFLNNFLLIALGFAGLLGLAMLLFGGIEYITAGGDKEATSKASKRITNALIGLVLVLVSFAIISLVGRIFGINLIEFNIPTIS